MTKIDHAGEDGAAQESANTRLQKGTQWSTTRPQLRFAKPCMCQVERQIFLPVLPLDPVRITIVVNYAIRSEVQQGFLVLYQANEERFWYNRRR